MKHTIPCPNCKEEGRVEIGENMLGDKIYVLRCEKCGSLSTCRDGIHWVIVVGSNIKKEVKGE